MPLLLGAVGLTGAFFGAEALSVVLYGVGARDIFTFGAAILVLLLVAFVANWIPARRAARVNPVTALRYE